MNNECKSYMVLSSMIPDQKRLWHLYFTPWGFPRYYSLTFLFADTGPHHMGEFWKKRPDVSPPSSLWDKRVRRFVAGAAGRRCSKLAEDPETGLSVKMQIPGSYPHPQSSDSVDPGWPGNLHSNHHPGDSDADDKLLETQAKRKAFWKEKKFHLWVPPGK